MDAALFERAFNVFRSYQRARRVMNSHIFRVAIDPTQASPNIILPTFAAGNNRADFFESCTGSDFSDFIVPLFTRHNYDFANGYSTFKRTDCVSDHWFARDRGKQFIEPHALAAAAGDDDGTQHGAEKKDPTPNDQYPISKSESSHSALSVEG